MKRFQAEDIRHLTYVSWPFLSGDGQVRGCVKYHAQESTGAFLSAIYLVRGGQETCLTQPGHSESQPILTHDGAVMYYLSDESGEKQVWRRTLATGETQQLTSLRHGVEGFVFS